MQVDVHHTDVPAAVLVQRGGGLETTEIPVDEPTLPSHAPSPTPSPAVDDETQRAVEYESDHDDHTPQKQKRTSTKCRQGFSKSWLAKFDWLTYNSVDNSMGCWLSNFHVKNLALHAASKVS